jgi:hypothetical protein
VQDDFYAAVQAGEGVFAFDPRTLSFFDAPTASPDALADWLTGHVLPEARIPLSQLLSGSVDFEKIDWTQLPSTKNSRRPGLYVIITCNADGTVRAIYIGSASAGSFSGSLRLMGPHDRCPCHDRHTLSAHPPHQLVYLDELGTRHSDHYELKLIVSYHDHDIPDSFAPPGLQAEHISSSIGDTPLTPHTVQGHMLRCESALMLMTGSLRRPTMPVLLRRALLGTELRDRVSPGLNVACGLEDSFRGSDERKASLLERFFNDWSSRVVQRATNGTAQSISILGENVRVSDAVTVPRVECFPEMDGSILTIHLRNPADGLHYQPITHFPRRFVAAFRERYRLLDDDIVFDEDDSGYEALRWPVSIPQQLRDGTYCRKLSRGFDTKNRALFVACNGGFPGEVGEIPLDPMLWSACTSERVLFQLFYRLPPGADASAADDFTAQPRVLVTSPCDGTHDNHPEISQLVSRLPKGVLKWFGRILDDHELSWADFLAVPDALPLKLAEADWVHPFAHASQADSRGKNPLVWDLLGPGFSGTLAHGSNWTLGAVGLKMVVTLPPGHSFQPGAATFWLKFDPQGVPLLFVLSDAPSSRGARAVVTPPSNLMTFVDCLMTEWGITRAQYTVDRPPGLLPTPSAWFRVLEASIARHSIPVMRDVLLPDGSDASPSLSSGTDSDVEDVTALRRTAKGKQRAAQPDDLVSEQKAYERRPHSAGTSFAVALIRVLKRP